MNFRKQNGKENQLRNIRKVNRVQQNIIRICREATDEDYVESAEDVRRRQVDGEVKELNRRKSNGCDWTMVKSILDQNILYSYLYIHPSFLTLIGSANLKYNSA